VQCAYTSSVRVGSVEAVFKLEKDCGWTGAGFEVGQWVSTHPATVVVVCEVVGVSKRTGYRPTWLLNTIASSLYCKQSVRRCGLNKQYRPSPQSHHHCDFFFNFEKRFVFII